MSLQGRAPGFESQFDIITNDSIGSLNVMYKKKTFPKGIVKEVAVK